MLWATKPLDVGVHEEGKRTTALLGGVLDLVVGLCAGEELFSAAAGRHVLDTHMYALPDDAVADLAQHTPMSAQLCQMADHGDSGKFIAWNGTDMIQIQIPVCSSHNAGTSSLEPFTFLPWTQHELSLSGIERKYPIMVSSKKIETDNQSCPKVDR